MYKVRPLKRTTSNQFLANPFPQLSVKTSQMALHRLISADDLSVVFQPILRLSTMKVFAYEALVRCRVEAYRNPMVLFERAAADGCTGRLGRMIREIAVPLCEGIPVFLNIHPVELEERWLVRPDDPMFSHDTDVYLELTEAVPMNQFELCKSVLADARSRTQVHLVIDDLGAGYSNLKYISDLKPKIVKLDRALIAGASRSSRQEQLIDGIVKMCNALGAEVVAEGIETEEELSVAKKAGVQFVQGYLFARPGFPLPLRDQVER